MLKLLEHGVTDYIIVMHKVRESCICAIAQLYELLPFETHTNLQDYVRMWVGPTQGQQQNVFSTEDGAVIKCNHKFTFQYFEMILQIALDL
jgi:hypothetical protein